MTERENALHYIMRDGKAQWIPGFLDSIEMVFPYEVVRERPTREEGSGYDYFGCWWEFEPNIGGSSPLPGKHPCKDVTKWREQVTFPDPEKLDWSKADAQAAGFDRENKLSMIFWESGPWERFHALCGFEESLIALYEEPEAVHELMQAITDFKIAMVAKIKEHYNPDIICVLDDFGHQIHLEEYRDGRQCKYLYGHLCDDQQDVPQPDRQSGEDLICLHPDRHPERGE